MNFQLKVTKKLKQYYEIEKCKTCDCFQGLLTQLELDNVDDKTKEEIKKMIVQKEKMHGCLGCDPCQPAELFSSYIKSKKQSQ